MYLKILQACRINSRDCVAGSIIEIRQSRDTRLAIADRVAEVAALEDVEAIRSAKRAIANPRKLERAVLTDRTEKAIRPEGR